MCFNVMEIFCRPRPPREKLKKMTKVHGKGWRLAVVFLEVALGNRQTAKRKQKLGAKKKTKNKKENRKVNFFVMLLLTPRP